MNIKTKRLPVKYFLTWLLGVLFGVGIILIIGPIAHRQKLNSSVRTMLTSNDPQVIKPIIDELYKDETTRPFVTGMLVMNIDNIPATPQAKLCALEKIQNSEDFWLASNICPATFDASAEVRQKALDVYSQYLYLSIYPQLATMTLQLYREDDSAIFDEKLMLLCNLLHLSYEDTKKYFEDNGVDANTDFLRNANYNQGEYLRSQLPENFIEKLY